MEAPREWPEVAPHIKNRAVTLIARVGDDLRWSHTVAGKKEVLEQTKGPLWAAWTGSWTTHIFIVPRDRAKSELGID